MEDVVTTQNIKTDVVKTDAISIDVNIEKAKELFNNCRYNEAEQMFSKICCSEAVAWRIFCNIITGNIGKKGGRVSVLLQESLKNQNCVNIEEVVILLKMLIDEYGGGISRKTKNKVIISLNNTFNDIMKDKMAMAISDVNKRALDIVKEKGYTPSIYDDKAIPLKILNNKLRKYRYRIRHYKPEETTHALKIINNENFLQEVVNDYMSMAHYNTTNTNREHLDTRNYDIIRYIKSLYISNIAYEKELKAIKSMDRLQFIDNLKKLNQKGWLRITILSSEYTKHFNMANDAERTMCEIEIERTPTTSIVLSLEYENIIEKRGYLIYDDIVNQISKEDIALGDVINRYTREYVGPVPGTIYCDN